MEIARSVFIALFITGLALVFPIFYDDIIAYNSNITLGPVIDQFPLVFIVLFAVFIAVYGWRKRDG